MNAIFTRSATVMFPLTEEQLVILKACSTFHYDATCREAATGFMAKWSRDLKWHEELPSYKGKVKAEFHDLDTSLKCMEWGPPGETKAQKIERYALSSYFNKLCNKLNDLYESVELSV